MQDIHVNRYKSREHGFQGSIEPEDRSWIVFVDNAGQATFWREVEVDNPEAPEAIGGVRHAYVDVEIPSLHVEGDALPNVGSASTPYPGPLDFTTHENEDGSFSAHLNVRDVAATAPTEREAIRDLLNYVAQLCTAGCLDHTGAPTVLNKRRYEHVWPGWFDQK